MSVRLTSVLAVLLAAVGAAASSASFPIKGYEFCTAPIQQFCAATVSGEKADRAALLACLRGRFDGLPATCQMNVRDHIMTPSDCPTQGGVLAPSDTCASHQVCNYPAHPNQHRCITG